ncbi:MAG: TRAP transporter small permease [Pseudorhodobacter sp.]
MTVFLRFCDVVDRLTGYIDRVCRWGLIFASGFILILLMTQVLMRYVLRSPLPWVEELSTYALGFMILWGAACYVRTWQHVRVGALSARLPMTLRSAILIGLNLLLVMVAWLLVTSGYKLAQLGVRELSPSGSFIMYWPRQAMTTGGVLILIQASNNVLRVLSGRHQGML